MTTYFGPPPPDDLAIGSWEDLPELADLLRLLDDRGREIVHHARSHVCDPDGFQPSPLCVLRPLVPVLRRVEDAFADLGRELGEEVGRLVVGVEQAAAAVAAADATAVDTYTRTVA